MQNKCYGGCNHGARQQCLNRANRQCYNRVNNQCYDCVNNYKLPLNIYITHNCYYITIPQEL